MVESAAVATSTAPSLTLCWWRPGGTEEEIHVAEGLSIGRSGGNTISLRDEPDVDPAHAKVVLRDGSHWLQCIQPSSRIIDGDSPTRALRLHSGTRFSIGRTLFKCRADAAETRAAERVTTLRCPYCRQAWDEKNLRGMPDGVQPCAHCRQEVVIVPAGADGASPLLVPAEYGMFRAQEFVARGGMGVVLKAIHRTTGVSAAVKLAHEGGGMEDRFRNEIQLLQCAKHPNLVQYLTHGRSGSYDFVVMEWADRSLKQVIAEYRQNARPVGYRMAAQWFVQVVRCLAALHRAGIVHRDLKPSNILIGGDGQARVADFGAIKRLNVRDLSDLTRTGQIFGTLHYIAPEQIDAPDTIDHRADQYSLGVTFYELLTGQLPRGQWQPASALNSSVPPEFDHVVSRLLAPRPEERFERVQDALRCMRKPRIPIPSRESVPRFAVLSAGALVGIAAGEVAAHILTLNPLIAGTVGSAAGLCAALATAQRNENPERSDR